MDYTRTMLLYTSITIPHHKLIYLQLLGFSSASVISGVEFGIFVATPTSHLPSPAIFNGGQNREIDQFAPNLNRLVTQFH